MEKAPALEKVELRENGAHKGFAVRCAEGRHALRFPHVYDLTGCNQLSLCAKSAAGASVTVLADGRPLAEIPLAASEDFTCITAPVLPDGDEQEITLVLQGDVVLDWFRFSSCNEA